MEYIQEKLNQQHDLLIAETKMYHTRINYITNYMVWCANKELEEMELLPCNRDMITFLNSCLSGEKRSVEIFQQSIKEVCQQKINDILDEHKKLTGLDGEMHEQLERIRQQINEMRPQQNNVHQQQGLSSARIQQFHKFQADESLVGDRCSVCQDDVEVGRRMMRLNCDGQHVFCQDCVEGWLANHNTCPNCRHVFH